LFGSRESKKLDLLFTSDEAVIDRIPYDRATFVVCRVSADEVGASMLSSWLSSRRCSWVPRERRRRYRELCPASEKPSEKPHERTRRLAIKRLIPTRMNASLVAVSFS